jgi:uncharacterized protein (UPF0335 family)
MPKQALKQYNVAHLQPDELGALRTLVKEFIGKIESVDNEIELLKGDRKEIIEEYTEKLDMKTLQAALRVLKIQQGVAHKDTYDLFLEALTEATDPSKP